MAKTPESHLELNLKEWEFLPDNASVEFGFEDVKALLSNDIIDKDYFMSEPCKRIQPSTDINNQGEEVEVKIKHEGEKPMECTRSAYSDPKQNTDDSKLSLHEIETPPPPLVTEEKVEVRKEEEEEEKAIWEGIRVGIWKWRLTVVGVLCSIGAAAAATMCVSVLGGGRDGEQVPHRCRHQNRVVQFSIHGDGKRLTKVVEEANKLNHALAAARGVPTMMKVANISFGGYYDSLRDS